jgi:hypothetical protein
MRQASMTGNPSSQTTIGPVLINFNYEELFFFLFSELDWLTEGCCNIPCETGAYLRMPGSYAGAVLA